MCEAFDVEDAHYNVRSVEYAGCPLQCVKRTIYRMPITMLEAFNMMQDAHYNT